MKKQLEHLDRYDGNIDTLTNRISNVRTCTIGDDESSSALVTVTFATYQFGFTMIPGQYANNEIGYMADFERKILRYTALQKFFKL